MPDAHTEVGLGALGTDHFESEAVAAVLLPVAFVVAAVDGEVGAVAFSLEVGEVAQIGAHGVEAYACLDAVVLPLGEDGAPQTVEGDARALASVTLPGAYVEGGEMWIDVDLETLALREGGHHLVTLVVDVVAVEVVGEVFLHQQG